MKNETEDKESGKLPDDWFWKLIALVGTLASIAGLIVSLIK